ncbi:hypothetical protein BT63DRAFT_298581 [Microthyrium microscopicum]|uniref:Mid2 domain-containing protein n=1 Tax=Microthyrium microscopicum TaxID=703497 RepID=A0A6A6U8S7_9PEZI|nr:hypothetical protein BT63DRAFT_298581 [Microthyrium microscopicum]
MSSNTSIAGFAIRRNGSCVAPLGEIDCGGTVAPYRVCCPHEAYCPRSNSYNAYCCDQANYNCTIAILSDGPFCANATWTMYDNGGYFCCDAGLAGYQNTITNSNGCANPGYQVANGENFLPPIGQKPKATANSTSIPEPTSTPSQISTFRSKSSNIGAIAGGVVGGVVLFITLLAILMVVARRQKQNVNSRAHELQKAMHPKRLELSEGPQHSAPAMELESSVGTRVSTEILAKLLVLVLVLVLATGAKLKITKNTALAKGDFSEKKIFYVSLPTLPSPH